MIACSVPKEYCSGHTVQVEPWRQSKKIHNNQKEVHNCIKRYMNLLGYSQNPMSLREFHKDGCPVRVISKRAGFRLRKGKEGTRWMSELITDGC